MIKALRIDHRLVHGQVAFTWSHHLGITRIIVIDDKSANDDFQKMALNMAKPAGTKLNVFTVDKALERVEKIESLTDNIFIIFGCAHDASRFITAHPNFKELNVGGIAKKRKQIMRQNSIPKARAVCQRQKPFPVWLKTMPMYCF